LRSQTDLGTAWGRTWCWLRTSGGWKWGKRSVGPVSLGWSADRGGV